ncbi:MAG: outer membrane lipoprotein-sorting protein [candidate division Zixibacteria bacterium]|nr:outer membrane lipoprotein-sorting protein [candidate division Zixibacteria bacterium]
MKSIITTIISAVLVLLIAGSVPAEEPIGREIMERYKAQDRTKDSSADLKMTLINASGGKRERQLTFASKTDAEDNRKMLLRFLSPGDVAGTGFLSIEYSDRDDDNWLYLPALRKTRRIAGSDKTDKFVGSEFTYEDMDTEDLNAYSYKLVASDTLDGVEAWVIEAIPTDAKKIKETAYSKRMLWVDKTHHLWIQVKYYDKEGAYSKVLRATDIRQVPGTDKWRAYVLTMEDVRKGDKSLVEYSDYEIDRGVKDEYFTERYLKRAR